MEATPQPLAGEAAPAAGLRAQVEQRLGAKLNDFEWVVMNPAGEGSAAELSPVEGVLLAQLASMYYRYWRGGLQLNMRPRTMLFIEAGRAELRRGYWLTGFICALAIGLVCWLHSVHEFPGSKLLLSGGGLAGVWIAISVVALIQCGALIALKAERLRSLRTVETRLASSDILQRIVENGPAVDALLAQVPWPWRMFRPRLGQIEGPFNFLTPRAQPLLGRAEQVIPQLDWALEPPRTPFRLEWLKRLLITWPTVALWMMLSVAVPGGGLWGLSAMVVYAFIRLDVDHLSLPAYYVDSLLNHMRRQVMARLAPAAPPL